MNTLLFIESHILFNQIDFVEMDALDFSLIFRFYIITNKHTFSYKIPIMKTQMSLIFHIEIVFATCGYQFRFVLRFNSCINPICTPFHIRFQSRKCQIFHIDVCGYQFQFVLRFYSGIKSYPYLRLI